jgi:hypothetical protein
VIELEQFPTHLTLKCLSGRVWVTCQGDKNDYLLKPGMEYRSSKKKKVVLWALAEASLSILDAAAEEHEAAVGMLVHA